MIRQIHLNECDSTQDILKEQLKQNITDMILVSCDNQNSGRGRGENKWKSMPGTVCFSLNIKPHDVMSFTALELSVIVVKFFETKSKRLKLKWPNDLWDESGKKCGGILIQSTHNLLVAGVGINIFSDDQKFGGVFNQAFRIDKKAWAYELGKFIHDNRYDSTEHLKKDWLKRCAHIDQMVRITESDESFEGIFVGIGDNGEALLLVDSHIKRIFNGSLRPIS
jgi:BirA family transcriptional regulator, biotin operon repressor / biotin---[acetyl-CoA-carboxylase] ligase